MNTCLEKTTEFPIFTASEYKNLVFLSGGGGGKNFGVQNLLETRNRINLESLFIIDLKEILVEGLYALPDHDCLIAYSDTQVFLYEIKPNSKIELKKEITFEKTAFSDFIKVYAFDKYLVIYDNNKFFRIYQVQKNKDLLEIFVIEVKERILNFYAVSEKNTKEIFVIFKDEILVFNVKEKKFINNILKNYPFLRHTHLSFVSNKQILMIGSDRDKTEVVFLEITQNNNFLIRNKLNLLKTQISAFCLKDNFLALSTVEGIVKVYKINNSQLTLLINAKLHDLPVKSIFIRKFPSPVEKENKINVSSFGLDYKIKSFDFIPEQIIQLNRFRMMKYMIIFILLLAFSIGFFIKY